MRPPQAHRRLSAGVLLLAVLPPHAVPQPPAVTATATSDQRTIWLSQKARVTLTVEGPAPLRVELPNPLLTAESAAAWRVLPPERPAVTPLPDGRERWSQAFRFDPYTTGDPVPLRFAPLKVRAGNAPEQEFDSLGVEVRVNTTITEVKPDSARPVTGIEPVEPRPQPPPEPVGWVIAVGAGLVVALGVVVGLIRRARARPRPLPPREWALAELDRLGQEEVPGAELADRLAAVLRDYVARRFGIPAPKLTTTELVAEIGSAHWSAGAVEELGRLLERCDRAKFAGDAPDGDESRALLGRAREWLLASGGREPPVSP
jgi:hypothetical protein